MSGGFRSCSRQQSNRLEITGLQLSITSRLGDGEYQSDSDRSQPQINQSTVVPKAMICQTVVPSRHPIFREITSDVVTSRWIQFPIKIICESVIAGAIDANSAAMAPQHPMRTPGLKLCGRA